MIVYHRNMADVQFVAAMGPPGGGRSFITPRYARHFVTVSITDFDDATLRTIFGAIIEWGLAREPFPPNVKVWGPCRAVVVQGCCRTS